MDLKEFLGFLASALVLCGNVPYLIGIHNGKLKPHAFSWLVWGLTQGIAGAAQFFENGGPGSWATILATFLACPIFVFSLKKGEKNITRGDWISLLLALSAIPLWVLTKNPLWSVLLVSLIDTLGFYPTYRKSWHKPYEEALLVYINTTITCGFSMAALETFSLTTYLYPATLAVTNTFFVVMLLVRRVQVRSLIVS